MLGFKLRRSWRIVALFAALTLGLAVAPPAFAIGQILDKQNGLGDLDARTGAVQPTAAQQGMVANLGANVTWNRFGTPESLINYDGYLATGLSSDPVAAARGFISSHAALFRLSSQGVSDLQLLNDSPLMGSSAPAHAVLFRQTFGGVPATQDGLITVGVVDGKVAYVSSSSAGDGTSPGSAQLSPAAAWVAAARNVGLNTSIANVVTSKLDNTTGWTGLKVGGLSQYQRVRLTAFPTYTQGIHLAYETIVLDTDHAWPVAYKEFVDAQTGKIWFRQNAVLRATTGCTPSNAACAYADTLAVGSTVECGPTEGPFTAPSGTKSIDVAAGEDVAVNDIILQLQRPKGTVIASQDLLFSPEAIHYEPTGGVPSGDYYVRVCPFSHATGDYTAPYTYHGTISMNPAGTGTPLGNTPKWKVFLANPRLNYASADTRVTACWLDSLNSLTPSDSDCQLAVKNTASRAPWDFDVQANQPTFSTRGNNANTAEAWISPLTPGGVQRPVAPDRKYSFPWTNAWFTSKCSPTSFTPGGNDIDASVTNLFVGHNRMHDFSYFLGFTEYNFNAQQSNFGNSAPGPYPLGRENDPELGDAQAGGVSGGSPSYEGRDNANQITLNDGIPPITNQYLWQPIAGAFYPPCVDGDFDTSVFGHEYTHLISNRMVAGPDAGLSGYQAGSMGESWSDLDAIEYQLENGYATGTDPFVVGAYATGNQTKGIRDYALDANPLNYSDLGFDTPGPEVHADGEIWNAVNYVIRRALVSKYNASFPASDANLQASCAAGRLPAVQCPGNRRWVQIMYDAWLLMQSGVSMLDARDAYLAADTMVFGGADRVQLWHAFSTRGMGIRASSNTGEDSDAKPSFASPFESNATVTFAATAADENGAPVKASIFVGAYQGRATPAADTDPSTALGATTKFVPGTYAFVVRAPGYGLTRFTRTFTAGQTTTVSFPLHTNWASTAKGAVASGDGTDLGSLIDDNEGSNWTATGRTPTVAGTSVTVMLGGGAHTITSVRVSAMIGPGENRFAALRQFRIDACNATAANQYCSLGSGFSPIYTSAPDAFPGLRPRPVAPDLILRTFSVPATKATHLRLVVLTNQCTGGPGFQGDQDTDPSNNSDCVSGSSEGQEVTAAELEAFKG